MKYLVYFRPDEAFLSVIRNCRRIARSWMRDVSSNEAHCTLMRLEGNDEGKIIEALESLTLDPFHVCAESLELFDRRSLVVRLEQTNELLDLHHRVIEGLKGYVDHGQTRPPLAEYRSDPARMRMHEMYGSVYCGTFYAPHITIARVDGDPLQGSRLDISLFEGHKVFVESFVLAKKERGTWKTLREF